MALTRGLVPAMEERFVVVLSFKSICCFNFSLYSFIDCANKHKERHLSSRQQMEICFWIILNSGGIYQP